MQLLKLGRVDLLIVTAADTGNNLVTQNTLPVSKPVQQCRHECKAQHVILNWRMDPFTKLLSHDDNH